MNVLFLYTVLKKNRENILELGISRTFVKICFNLSVKRKPKNGHI